MNMQALMKQAQTLQKDMTKAQNEIEKQEFEGESSVVKVKINGKHEVLSVKIDSNANLTSDDLEMLEDMIMIAINNISSKIDKVTKEKMGPIASGLPGLM